jgi:predicted neuraminidase
MSRNSVLLFLFATISAAAVLPANQAGEQEPPKQAGILKTEFLYTQAPFPQCHASTLAETKHGLVAAWFGGTREGHADVGIWLSRHVDGAWTAPVEVANGVQYVDEGGMAKRHPCWNPVLFQPKSGPLLLFYKCGPSPSTWWGLLMKSSDGGKTWSDPCRLPEGILGPVRNHPIQLPNGDILCGSSTEHSGWTVHFEITPDLGKSWVRVGPVTESKKFGAIQPALFVHPDGKIQALCRSKQNAITETWSADGGKTWSAMQATTLPNPNSGIAGLTLKDGRHLLVYNHTTWGGPSPHGREMLNVAISADGKVWKAAAVLEKDAKGEFSYPAVIQTQDGQVHVTYTWKRTRIKHVVLDPAKLELRDLVNGKWPG